MSEEQVRACGLIVGDDVLYVQREPRSEEEIYQIAWSFCLRVIEYYGAMDTFKIMYEMMDEYLKGPREREDDGE